MIPVLFGLVAAFVIWLIFMRSVDQAGVFNAQEILTPVLPQSSMYADTTSSDSGSDSSAPQSQDASASTAATGITNDPSTWPTGDRIWDVARAIAHAEGYDVAGSVPNRLNNPGDISDGSVTFGSEHHSGSNVTHFPDAQTGWQWLYDKLNRIVEGKSTSYHRDWTWTSIAKTWAGDWQNWVHNVTADPVFGLGVSETDVFGDYFK